MRRECDRHGEGEAKKHLRCDQTYGVGGGQPLGRKPRKKVNNGSEEDVTGVFVQVEGVCLESFQPFQAQQIRLAPVPQVRPPTKRGPTASV